MMIYTALTLGMTFQLFMIAKRTTKALGVCSITLP
jgi:hypothetical protein